MKAIIITGTPGTGKTKLAKSLESKNIGKYIDVNKIINKYKLAIDYDKKRKCKIVDEKKLIKIIEKMIKNSKKTLIIDSHLSHYINKDLVKICFVLRCDPKELKKRLKKRKYNKNKINENCEAEKLDVILIEALENGHNVCEINTTNKKIEETTKEALSIINKKKKCKFGKINWNI